MLSEELHRYNCLAAMYRSMKEELDLRANNHDGRVPKMLMRIVSHFEVGNWNSTTHKKRLEEMQDKGMVCLFFEVNSNDEPFERYGLNIYPRSSPGNLPRPIEPYSEFVDAFSYPLLFPYGKPDFKQGKIPLVKRPVARFDYIYNG